MRRFFVVLILAACAAGCAYPTSGVRVTDDRPSVAVQGAPRGALLYVDGLAMGEADQYDGKPHALLVEPGMHRIEIVSGGRKLLSETVFLGGGELKVFRVTEEGRLP